MSTHRDLARIFYEQCAGTTPGHMANVPNNPILFSILSAVTKPGSKNAYACSKESFSTTLRKIADALDDDDQF